MEQMERARFVVFSMCIDIYFFGFGFVRFLVVLPGAATPAAPNLRNSSDIYIFIFE